MILFDITVEDIRVRGEFCMKTSCWDVVINDSPTGTKKDLRLTQEELQCLLALTFSTDRADIPKEALDFEQYSHGVLAPIFDNLPPYLRPFP